MTTQEPRTFSEQEHLAILADRVATETASLSESLTTLTAAKTELETKLDVAVAEKAAAEKAAADAVQALEDFKASLEAEKAAEATKEERLTKVKAAAAHLPEEFFTDETRVARIVAMSDETFEGYVADLAATNAAPASTEGAPKETAMTGSQVNPPKADEKPVSAALNFLLPHLATEGGK
jgi:chromosome segregation ATPase